jgi:hypothetical protein
MFCLQFQEHGIDNLDNVIPSHFGQSFKETSRKVEPAGGIAVEVNVARVIFPVVAVACNAYLLSDTPQALSQSVVYVAVFT